MFKVRTKAVLAAALAATLCAGIVALRSAVAAQTETPTARNSAAQQNQEPAPTAEHGGARGSFRLPYPEHAQASAEVVARGKSLFEINCAFCHGADAAGGAVGPNLLRSQIVIADKDGELIAPIIHGARADRGMPAIDLPQSQISDIASFLHSFVIIGARGDTAHSAAPIDIVVGDAVQGKAAFNQACASCHSVTGDLSGIASKIPNPRTLQQTWLLPGGPGRLVSPSRQGGATGNHVPPMMATVTLSSGEKIEGTLYRIDDFYIGLTTNDGTFRSFLRHGDEPRVELHDPVAPHRVLLGKYTGKEIHDITAYLVTIK
jgi:mono/diheme cytochrome c family protein